MLFMAWFWWLSFSLGSKTKAKQLYNFPVFWFIRPEKKHVTNNAFKCFKFKGTCKQTK